MTITCLIKKEGSQYASLCVELDVASCGKSKTEALNGLKRAIETYIEYMVSEGRQKEIYRPVPMDELKGFFFPGDKSSEETFRAIPLNYQYAQKSHEPGCGVDTESNWNRPQKAR